MLIVITKLIKNVSDQTQPHSSLSSKFLIQVISAPSYTLNLSIGTPPTPTQFSYFHGLALHAHGPFSPLKPLTNEFPL